MDHAERQRFISLLLATLRRDPSTPYPFLALPIALRDLDLELEAFSCQLVEDHVRLNSMEKELQRLRDQYSEMLYKLSARTDDCWDDRH